MANDLLEFSKKLNDEDCIITLGYRSKSYFDMNTYSILTLDDEDIQYFKSKYFPKLEEELLQKIENLKGQYSNLFIK